MKIAILGFGSQGKSAYQYWNTEENELTICDENLALSIPDGARAKLGEDYLESLDEFDLLVRTPILHPAQIIKANPDAPDILKKVTTNTNEFMKVCPSKNIVGVTGTKGKGTTSTLIAKMLEAAGYTAYLGGNIGIPPLEMLKNNIKPDDWVVLELANFQLIDLQTSPKIAVCLMVEPEHLDWHKDFDEYKKAKQQLFSNQSKDDIAVYYADNENSQEIASASQGNKIPYLQPPGASIVEGSLKIENQKIINTDDIKLLGKHNLQNICAAATALWQIQKDVEAIGRVLLSFPGLPFRIEHRRQKNGIDYYNDSFATGPGSAVAALEAIKQPKVVIIGGYERNIPLDGLITGLINSENHVEHIVLVGQSAARVQRALEAAKFSNFTLSNTKDMDSIVTLANTKARSGDAIVLSPGFASFDMFKNFEVRGNEFNRVVENL